MSKSTVIRDLSAWLDNPTPRTHARLVASMARMDAEMSRCGMKDVYYKDARSSFPRELRSMMELYKKREGHELSAA